MSRAKIELDRLRIQPGDVIVLKQKSPVDTSVIIDMIKGLKQALPDSDHLICVLPCGMQIDSLDEKDMNRQGWFRKDHSDVNPS